MLQARYPYTWHCGSTKGHHTHSACRGIRKGLARDNTWTELESASLVNSTKLGQDREASASHTVNGGSRGNPGQQGAAGADCNCREKSSSKTAQVSWALTVKDIE